MGCEGRQTAVAVQAGVMALAAVMMLVATAQRRLAVERDAVP